MKKPRIYRHGDVLLVEVEKAEGKNTEDRMLASGEEANHGHFVTGKAKVTKQGEQLFVRSMTGTLIRHLLIEQFKEKQEVWTKEHADIQLPDNTTFKVVRQVEYDPYEKVIRTVQD